MRTLYVQNNYKNFLSINPLHCFNVFSAFHFPEENVSMNVWQISITILYRIGYRLIIYIKIILMNLFQSMLNILSRAGSYSKQTTKDDCFFILTVQTTNVYVYITFIFIIWLFVLLKLALIDLKKINQKLTIKESSISGFGYSTDFHWKHTGHPNISNSIYISAYILIVSTNILSHYTIVISQILICSCTLKCNFEA